MAGGSSTTLPHLFRRSGILAADRRFTVRARFAPTGLGPPTRPRWATRPSESPLAEEAERARPAPAAGDPVEYGIKNTQRIGTIRFTFSNERPASFRTESDYDW